LLATTSLADFFYVARKPARQITTPAAITLFGAARQFNGFALQ